MLARISRLFASFLLFLLFPRSFSLSVPCSHYLFLSITFVVSIKSMRRQRTASECQVLARWATRTANMLPRRSPTHIIIPLNSDLSLKMNKWKKRFSRSCTAISFPPRVVCLCGASVCKACCVKQEIFFSANSLFSVVSINRKCVYTFMFHMLASAHTHSRRGLFGFKERNTFFFFCFHACRQSKRRRKGRKKIIQWKET